MKTVCIVGAGLAGLACALAAAMRGLVVQVYDESSQARSLPAHIEIVPGMLRDLASLGVAEECVRAGFAFRGIDVIDRHGRHLYELPTERLAGPQWPASLGMRHDDLMQVLQRAAARHGAQVTRGSRVTGVSTNGPVACVQFADGTVAEAHLVLLAAGASSALKRTLFPEAEPVVAQAQTWFYTLLPRPIGLDRPLIAHGPAGRRAVLVPTRHDEVGLAVTETGVRQGSASLHECVRSALSKLAPRLRLLASLVDEHSRIALRPVCSALLPMPWHRGRVLAVGDFAHALPPHLGQAAAQAMEDARVLADQLAQAQAHEPAAFFSAYEQRRAARVRKVHEITTTAARWDLRPDAGTDLGQLMQRLMHTVAQPA